MFSNFYNYVKISLLTARGIRGVNTVLHSQLVLQYDREGKEKVNYHNLNGLGKYKKNKLSYKIQE